MRLYKFLIFNLLSFFSFAQPQLIVQELPAGTPDSVRLYVAGNFNAWNPQDEKYRLQKQSDGSFSVNLPNATIPYEFKFTQGSWQTVETDEQGNDIANRIAQITDNQVFIKIKAWKKGEPKKMSTASANVKIIAEAFKIPQLNRNRRIWVYLPPDYEANPQKRYPVLYMQDGQNLFDEATSYAGEWAVDKTLDDLHAKGESEGIIVVGIDNGSNFRANEYSPWKRARLGGGEGYKYVRFIAQTLKPYIDKRFRTLKQREYTGIMGSSMGGLISFYAGLKFPRVFGRVGVFSPSFWFAPKIYEFAQTYQKRLPSKFYFIAGAQESANLVRDTQTMIDILKSRGFSNQEISYQIHPDGKHSEWYWRREFATAYRFLF
ncbi:MAG: alpha/beta hydrolase-fold protein [Microscillaceae bacterium]|jgi:metallo-beta-lactamase class B|nr:alpha/beta hydrolase-fold protein [Microscillaceae bacterium]